MTISSIANVRRFRVDAAVFPRWPTILAWLVIPLALGWFGFALIDSTRNFAPQEIRLSAEGEYDPYLDDFVVFYGAGSLVRGNGAGNLYEPSAVRDAQARALSVPSDSIIQLPFYNPPAYVLPLVVLAALPLATAAVVFSAIQLVAFAASAAALWSKECRRSSALAGVLVLATVSSMPFHETVLHGQVSFLFVAAWLCLWFGAFERRDDRLVVLALVVLAMKPQLAIVPIAYLLLTRRWRALLAAAGLEAALGIVATAALGPTVYLRWLGLLLEAMSWEDQNGIWVHAMFGWNAFTRALVGEGHQLVRASLTAALSAATALYCLRASRALHIRERQVELFAMLVFASVLMSPHLFAQDLILLATPLALLVLRRTGRERGVWLAFGALGWFLTFMHFELLLGTPEEVGVNFVSLWLGAGLVLAGAALRRHLHGPHVESQRPETQRSGPALALQFALGSILALVLFATVPGLVGQKMANAIEYSYSSLKGQTYRIVVVGLSSE